MTARRFWTEVAIWLVILAMVFTVLDGPDKVRAQEPPTTADVTLEVSIDPPGSGTEVCFTRELTLPVPDKETFCAADGDVVGFLGLAPGGYIVFGPSNTSAVWYVEDLGCKPTAGVTVSGNNITVALQAQDTVIECYYDIQFNAIPTATPAPATATPVPATATPVPPTATPEARLFVCTGGLVIDLNKGEFCPQLPTIPAPTLTPTLQIIPPNTGSGGIR